MAVQPSVAKSSLMINASAGCSMLGSTCPQPDDLTWHSYDAWVEADGKDSESYLMPPSEWDDEYTALLNLTGAGNFFADQVVLHPGGDLNQPAELDFQGMALSKDWTVNLGTKQYTKSIGLVSLHRAWKASPSVRMQSLTCLVFLGWLEQQSHIRKLTGRDHRRKHHITNRL